MLKGDKKHIISASSLSILFCPCFPAFIQKNIDRLKQTQKFRLHNR